MFQTKHNSNRKKQVIFLMIPNVKGWHYISEKQLLRKICIININNVKTSR